MSLLTQDESKEHSKRIICRDPFSMRNTPSGTDSVKFNVITYTFVCELNIGPVDSDSDESRVYLLLIDADIFCTQPDQPCNPLPKREFLHEVTANCRIASVGSWWRWIRILDVDVLRICW